MKQLQVILYENQTSQLRKYEEQLRKMKPVQVILYGNQTSQLRKYEKQLRKMKQLQVILHKNQTSQLRKYNSLQCIDEHFYEKQLQKIKTNTGDSI